MPSLRDMPGFPSGNVSLLADVLGYRNGQVPRRPDGSAASISLRDWLGLRAGNSFNLNIVVIGSNAFTGAMWTEIDVIIHRMREIYAQIGIGVRFVKYWEVSVADAGGLDVITTDAEVDDLLSTWSVPNAGIDLFVPAGWMPPGNLLGRSAKPGPCPGDKDEGSCVGLTGALLSARSAAHEVGHYLSLEHSNDLGRTLMCQTQHADSPTWQAVAFTVEHAEDVKDHCMVLES